VRLGTATENMLERAVRESSRCKYRSRTGCRTKREAANAELYRERIWRKDEDKDEGDAYQHPKDARSGSSRSRNRQAIEVEGVAWC